MDFAKEGKMVYVIEEAETKDKCSVEERKTHKR